MKTFNQEIKSFLIERGMPFDQAEAVIAKFIALKANDAMKERWNEETDDYPKIMLASKALYIKPINIGVS